MSCVLSPRTPHIQNHAKQFAVIVISSLLQITVLGIMLREDTVRVMYDPTTTSHTCV